MADKKYTNRDFYTEILKGKLTKEAQAHAKEALAKLDETNEKRKTSPSKASIENAPIAKAIADYLNTLKSGQTAQAKEIASAVGQTVPKVTAVLRAMIDNGEVTKHMPDKTSKPMEYSIYDAGGEVENEDEADDVVDDSDDGSIKEDEAPEVFMPTPTPTPNRVGGSLLSQMLGINQ